jgi:biopolymer transport protein TolR
MKLRTEPNVVPLCDILLVLLIIFMVISPMVSKGLDVKIPEGGQPGQALVISVEEDGRIFLNREEFASVGLLKLRLREVFHNRTSKTVHIRGHARLPYSQMVSVIDAAKGEGIDVVSLIASRYYGEQSR